MQIINLDVYRKNKDFCKNLQIISDFFKKNYPDKSWGWVGITALLFSQLAVETHLTDPNLDPNFIPALKSVLWQFMSILNNETTRKEDRHE
jgi:hypothetical protein